LQQITEQKLVKYGTQTDHKCKTVIENVV